jgi:SAM-dependent methyltransferase
MAPGRIPGTEEAKAYVSRFNFFARYVHGPEEGEIYIATHIRRFVETLKRVSALPAPLRILELGAVPYSMTILLRHYLRAEVTPLSFYEVEEGRTLHLLESPDGLERYEFPYRPVNVERDVYPLPDASFDVVLCCEILEHLLINPSHMLFESHRVLKPGGHVLISTPNVTRAENVRRLSEGRNISDAYHGNGIYGRHNREFTATEVATLLESCGFTVTRSETIDVYDTTPAGASPGREDTIFTLAQATAQGRIGIPPDLYVLMDEYSNVIRSSITMAIDDVGHLGPGWYGPESEGERTLRWTRDRAVFHLLLAGSRAISMTVQVHHPDVAQRPVIVSLSAGGRTAGERVVSDHRWQDVVFELPHAMSGPTEFELALDRDWTPGGDDSRRLGIRVHRCRAGG